MTAVIFVLLLFLGIGLFSRTYNPWTRVLLITVIAGMIFYLILTP
jgi:hypothetical protein